MFYLVVLLTDNDFVGVHDNRSCVTDDPIYDKIEVGNFFRSYSSSTKPLSQDLIDTESRHIYDFQRHIKDGDNHLCHNTRRSVSGERCKL